MWKNKKIILVFPYFYPHAGACANRGRSFYKYLSKKFFTKVICQNNKKGNQKDVYKINQKNFFVDGGISTKLFPQKNQTI